MRGAAKSLSVDENYQKLLKEYRKNYLKESSTIKKLASSIVDVKLPLKDRVNKNPKDTSETKL